MRKLNRFRVVRKGNDAARTFMTIVKHGKTTRRRRIDATGRAGSISDPGSGETATAAAADSARKMRLNKIPHRPEG